MQEYTVLMRKKGVNMGSETHEYNKTKTVFYLIISGKIVVSCRTNNKLWLTN